MAPALAAGCSVVLKTSPEAPLSPAIFTDVVGELVAERAHPGGVVSVFTADREVSESLVVDPKDEGDAVAVANDSQYGLSGRSTPPTTSMRTRSPSASAPER